MMGMTRLLGRRGISRRRFLKGIGTLAGAAALGALSGCAGQKAARKAEPIKLGALFDLTGALAPMGKEFERAARLAEEHINNAGGPLGRPIRLIIKDSGTSVQVGRDAAEKLVEIEKVPVIIGSLASGVTLAVSSITIPKKVVLISPASTSVAITDLEDEDYVFRTPLSDAAQGPILARVALEQGYKRVSTLFVNNAYGKGLGDLFKAKFEEQGGQVLAHLPYEENKASYRGEVEQAIKDDPDAIVLIAYIVDGLKIVQQAIELGYQGKWLFSDGMEGEGVAKGPTQKYLEASMIGTTHGALETEEGEKYFAEFERRYGSRPEAGFTPQVYDAVAVAALAIHRAGKPEGPAIRENLRAVANPPGEPVGVKEFEKAFKKIGEGQDVDYVGASGPVDFDEHGDVRAGAIVIWRVEGGKIVYVRKEKVEF